MNSPVQKGDRHARVAEPIPRPMVLQISRGVGAEVSETGDLRRDATWDWENRSGSCVSGRAWSGSKGTRCRITCMCCWASRRSSAWRTRWGFLKGQSAIRIHREYLGRQRNFTGYHFWARGVLRQHGRFGRRGHPRLHPEAGSRGKETREAGTRLIEGPFEGPSSYRPLRGR